MAYDWASITRQRSAEAGYYRLLGEMMHRRATPTDLQELREYLTQMQLSDDVWLSLGEGLFHTTAGASIGYRMWCAWSRNVLGAAYDEVHQLEAWQQFRAGTSDGLEQTSDADPPTVSFDLEDPEDRTLRTAVERPLAQDLPAAVRLIPAGPHTIRLFGEVYEGVDEFAVLKLLGSGVFFELEILFGVRWYRVAEHTGFLPIVERLRAEAIAQLATREQVRPEPTIPGAR